MARYTEAHLMKLSKRKLVKLLEKEGIDASGSQKKSELVRLLILAHKANAPSRVTRLTSPHLSRRSIVGVIVVILIFLSASLLYVVSPVFKQNVQYIFGFLSGSNQEDEPDFTGDGPVIYEQGGKTYVVYDHPRPKVDVVTDKNCKRPECDLTSYYDQIKETITPLAEFTEYDYQSRHAKGIIKNYDVNLLPILIFDKTVEKTENFERSSRFLKKMNDKYVLQLSPFKALQGPDLTNGQLLGKPIEDGASLVVVEYTSFSCPHCVDVYSNLRSLLETYEDDITIIVKYFSRGGNDFQAAVAAECAGQQGKFLEMHDLLFENQQEWLPMNDASLASKFNQYAAQIPILRSEFTECYNENQAVKDLVTAHTEEAEGLGIDGLPAFFINNNIVQGAYPFESFTEIIDEILKEGGFEVLELDEEEAKEEPANEETEEATEEGSPEEVTEEN